MNCICARLCDLGHRQNRQVPFRGSGHLHRPLQRREPAHLHLDRPPAFGQVRKGVASLRIGQYRGRFVCPPRRYGRSRHRQRSELDHTPMLGSRQKTGSEQHDR